MEKKETIEEYLEKKKKEIDQIIEKHFPRKIDEKWLKLVFGKPRYSFSKKAGQEVLTKPVWELLERGGKRWRPALFLLILEALGKNPKKFLDFAIIPELIHNGSLIIDDVEDQGELRRGKPCLHRMFGVDVAINAGNFLYFFPFHLLFQKKRKLKKETLLKFYETSLQEMINIHLGQGTDIFWHRGKAKRIEEKEYLQMCAFKTGCLARMAAKLAVVLANGDEKLAEKIGYFAESLGIAFQIQDDILDLTLTGKEREKFGKSFGNDIKEGKRTLMVVYTLKKANKRDKKRLLEILDKHTDDETEKKEAIEIIKKYGGIDYAKKVAKNLVKESWQGVEKLLPESRAKERLRELFLYLIERKL